MTRLQQIGPEHAEQAYEFCTRQPVRCTYLAGWIHEGGLQPNSKTPRGWLLVERNQSEDIVGLTYISATGIVIPVLLSGSAFDQIVTIGRLNPGMIRVLVGERSQIGTLWTRMKDIGVRARIDRDQIAYTVDRERFRPDAANLELEPAKDADLDDIVAASAAMAREEANDDPLARNPTLFRKRIQARIVRGRDFIHRSRGVLAFKSNVSALSPLGGQLEGIYTMPELRRQHFGRRGTSAATSWILERAKHAVLLVNDDNLVARQLYTSLGYREDYASRTIFLAP